MQYLKLMLRASTERAARSTPSKAPESPVEIQIPNTSWPALANDSKSSSSTLCEGWLEVGGLSAIS